MILRTALTILILCCSSNLYADSPENTILILYNHGSTNNKKLNCMKSWLFWGEYLALPQWARNLRGREIEDLNGKRYTIEVEFVCSNIPDDKQNTQLYVCARATEIIKKIEKYALTYPRRQIFLAGHSAGSWASLLIKRGNPQSINGLILVAPAFNGKREERTCTNKDCDGDPQDIQAKQRMDIRALHDKYLSENVPTGPPLLDALIVAFPCDSFGWPDELPFTANHRVDLRIFPPLKKPGEIEENLVPLSCRDDEPEQSYTSYRYYNGTPLRFCEEVQNRNQFPYPICSAGRIAGCPVQFWELCIDKSHKFYDDYRYRDYWFRKKIKPAVLTNWFVRDGKMVQNFIKLRLSEWDYGEGKPASEPPCEFMKELTK